MAGKASTRAHNKYNAKAYDRINLTVPKGRKDSIQAHAAALGESVNGFIGRAISETMERDGGGGPQKAAEAPSVAGVSLPSDTLKTAQEVAEAAGEDLSVYIARVVSEAAERDRLYKGQLKEEKHMALPAEKERYTLADALAWDEQDRIELIDGYPMMMAPPNRAHQEAVMEISAQLHAYLKGKKCKVYPAPFAVRPFEEDGDRPEDVDTLVEPDISVVGDPSKLDDAGCRGAPDLVMEILSPSTMRHDRFTKFNLYQRAGVREYWIIDPASKSVQVFVLEDGRYTAQDFGAAGDTVRVNVLKDCTIDLSQVFPE